MAPTLIRISITNIHILFVFYAEPRGPMPLQNKDYLILSLENMRLRLSALEDIREGGSLAVAAGSTKYDPWEPFSDADV